MSYFKFNIQYDYPSIQFKCHQYVQQVLSYIYDKRQEPVKEYLPLCLNGISIKVLNKCYSFILNRVKP